jgi:hypothetical protein
MNGIIGMFTTDDGVTHPISEISRIYQPRYTDAMPYRQIALQNNQRAELSDREADQLLMRPVQLLPALPGTSVLHATELPVLRAPVIAWALCLDGEVRAVTPAGINDRCIEDGEVWIETADGKVYGVGVSEPCSAADVDELHREMRNGQSSVAGWRVAKIEAEPDNAAIAWAEARAALHAAADAAERAYADAAERAGFARSSELDSAVDTAEEAVTLALRAFLALPAPTLINALDRIQFVTAAPFATRAEVDLPAMLAEAQRLAGGRP